MCLKTTPNQQITGFMIDLSKMVYEISNNPVVLDQNKLFNYQKTDYKAKSLWKSFGGQTPVISYDIYGSVTGRLTTKLVHFQS